MERIFEEIRRHNPLVAGFTNTVTVNDCANAILAVGGSPCMPGGTEETLDFARVCGSLLINIGTWAESGKEVFLQAARAAAEFHKPAVLDPVGAGAVDVRTKLSGEILDTGGISVIRGNVSEVRALAGLSSCGKGVDAGEAELLDEGNLTEHAGIFAGLAKKTGTVAVVSGPIDLITDGTRTVLVRNGVPMLARITGSGCMLSALTAAAAAVAADRFEGVLAMVCAMGIAGEKAAASLKSGEGLGTFRIRLMDNLSLIDDDVIAKEAEIERI